jgi:type I restriction enzyme R subunit
LIIKKAPSVLAYRLSSLHNAQDKRVFEAVIVITDRKVLDKQLQDNIYQIEHKTGVVQKIDEDSTQLAEALVQGTPIIITTLQKFPFVMEKVGALPNRKYAIIIDEVHGSQTGESAKKLKEVLTAKDLEEAEREERETNEDEDAEDNIRRSMEARGKQSNLSYYGFTATPKDKTLQIFGTKNSEGDFEPFHLYSMKQAIEERFIMDILLNYTPYELFFKLSKSIENDPTLNKKKTVKAIGRFVSLHPHNLAQKTEIIIEHFKNIVMHKIGGKAKAMVVSSSRLHAVRYKKSFDSYIKEKGYTQIRALVAFSGKVMDNSIEETEVKMNGFKEKELPEKFHNEYQILLVADKYQTGFDEPLLHTMYVDKKLSGVKAVQTLSRLNRTTTGKEDTFILDFVNDTDIIVKSFQPYYTCTLLEKGTDPNLLYDLKNFIEKAQIVWQSEVLQEHRQRHQSDLHRAERHRQSLQ